MNYDLYLIKLPVVSACLLLYVCRHTFIEPSYHMVAHTYVCRHMVEHTYVYRHIYMYGIHMYISVLDVRMPGYVYLYICIGYTYDLSI